MHRFRSVLQNVFALAALFVLTGSLLFIFSNLQDKTGTSALQSTSPRPCVPTPDQHSAPSEIGASGLPLPTITPLPFSKTNDLAPELSNQDKVYVQVMRCNGTFELFLVRPNAVLSETIPLQSGDVILRWFPPASSMGHRPPRPVSGTTLESPLATPPRSSNPTFSSPLATPRPTVRIPPPPTSTSH